MNKYTFKEYARFIREDLEPGLVIKAGGREYLCIGIDSLGGPGAEGITEPMFVPKIPGKWPAVFYLRPDTMFSTEDLEGFGISILHSPESVVFRGFITSGYRKMGLMSEAEMRERGKAASELHGQVNY